MEVCVTNTVWDKIIAYSKEAYDQFKTEIGGMAIAYRLAPDDPDFILDDPVILQQQVSAGNTILDKEALADYYVKTAMENKDKIDLSFVWWHSHHTMKAFWSSTDLAAIDEINLKEEYKFRVNVWKPVQIAEDIELIRITDVDEYPGLKDEVAALCGKIEPVKYNYNYGTGTPLKSQSNISLWDERDYPPAILTDLLENEIKDLCYGVKTSNQFLKAISKLRKDAEKTTEFSIGNIKKKDVEENMMFLTSDNLIYKKKETWNVDDIYEDNTYSHHGYNFHGYGGGC